jgi:Formate/nitrite transporter
MLEASIAHQLVLSIYGGACIAFGAALSVFLSAGIPWGGVQRFFLGVGFVGGFSMVILSSSALFTEVNTIMPVMLLFQLHRIRQVGFDECTVAAVDPCSLLSELCLTKKTNKQTNKQTAHQNHTRSLVLCVFRHVFDVSAFG